MQESCLRPSWPVPVTAATVVTPEMSVPALVMKDFVPFMVHSWSSVRAAVVIALGSDPASGSVMANAASILPEANEGIHSARCSSVPKSQTGLVPSEVCAATVMATDESTRASSSIARAYASVSPPAPP